MARRGVNPKTGKRWAWEEEQAAIEAQVSDAAIKKGLLLLKRQEKINLSRDDLLAFSEFTMPDPAAPNDVTKSTYEAAQFHKEVAKALEAVERGEIQQLIFAMPPRHGKSIAHDQPILTPRGWRKHGDLRVGDTVFGPDGQPTEVIGLSADVDEVVPVTFSNGEVVRCHLNHEWTVFDRSAGRWRTLETRDIAARTLRNGPEGRGGRWTLQLPDTPCLVWPETELPVDPYVLGAWLGDGNAQQARIAHASQDEAVVEGIEAAGFKITNRFTQESTGVCYAQIGGLRGHLRRMGVLDNKHVPETYLRASAAQRLSLLAGLVDTDGHVERDTGRVRFSTCSEALRDGVYDLALTLGFRPYVVEVQPATSSSGIVGRKVTYQVGFQPTMEIPTRLERKAIKVIAKRRRVGIVSVGPVETGGARSIQVQREDGLYVVGRHCVVTHNTQLATKNFAAWLSGRHPEWNIAVASYSDTMAEDMGADTRAIMTGTPFRQVFTDHKLRRGGTSKSNIQTDKGGRLVFVGRGGALTGRGADCFAEGTEVETPDGTKKIEEVRVGEKVLSYDERSGRCVWRRVEAVARRPRARLFRLCDNAGRTLEVTGDHRVYANSGWIEAAQLAAGDRLLCAVRHGERAAGGRGHEALPARADGLLLLEHLLGAGREPEAARGAYLRAVRSARAESERLLRIAETGPDILFGGLHGGGAGGGTRRAGAVAAEAVRTLQRDVSAAYAGGEVLFAGLHGPVALGVDEGRAEPALGRGRVAGAHRSAQRQAVSGNATVRDEAGRGSVCSLLVDRTAGSASHRREPAEQPRGEPRYGLPYVPPSGTLFGAEGSVVVSVEDTRRDAFVYDIQVEETRCFFANGVLAHNCLLIDDLYKDHEEARSQTIRDQAWNWFTKVAMTRRMGRKLVVITMTRWHSDDIVGRITDPENPCYNAIEAKKWKIIRLPALAEEEDPLGRPEGEVLWPERFDLDFMQSQQRLDPLGFAALYQQRPTVADGVLFRRETIQMYHPEDLPADLRIYCSSDHAVATGQRNDYTVMFKVGVDRQNNIWVLDCFRAKVSADKAVEAMLAMASGKQKPLLWWAERGHISKSIGPFLRKRMLETGTYINLVEVTPAVDKEQRAQSIVARVAMGKVYFPIGKMWTEKVVNEMLAFPNGLHDDAVDALAYIGLGLQSQFAPGRDRAKDDAKAPKFGTLAWVKQADKWAAEKRAQASAGGF